MRSRLVNGRILPPSSPQAARDRYMQLDYEITKIERLDGDRRERAQGNLGWLRDEMRQLAAWMLDNGVLALPVGVPVVSSLDPFWGAVPSREVREPIEETRAAEAFWADVPSRT